ncbi:hypothetical protein GGS23DRAFT_377298 [Durotheca rogersii]|uniref:uncharacterized protein n=1 Tax=Durotheca rogersii TaxID=419775 RepID=UPI00221E5D27|nr:uncharacterized protein GGS23DRAFT_377298 [Durotheca rogersii]KAI5866254.1 hypothetical protein GGS23DRAFT_377298 [Durotheca rogersii]
MSDPSQPNSQAGSNIQPLIETPALVSHGSSTSTAAAVAPFGNSVARINVSCIVSPESNQYIVGRADKDARHPPSGYPSPVPASSRGAKRPRVEREDDGGECQSKRQQCSPATPPTGPFQVLKPTKPGGVGDHHLISNTFACHDAALSQLARYQHPYRPAYLQQMAPQQTPKPGGGSQYQATRHLEVGSAAGSDITRDPPLANDRFLVPATTASARRTAYAARSSSHGDLTDTPTEPREHTPLSGTRLRAEKRGNECAGATAVLDRLPGDAITDWKDEYPVDGLMEEEMACLLDTALNSVWEAQVPPSSVTKDWDRDSRSATEYDATLQHSSPPICSEKPKATQGGLQGVGRVEEPGDVEDDLLDEGVDWNAVYAAVSTIPDNASAVNCRDAPRSSSVDQISPVHNSGEVRPGVGDETRLRPFVRPPFPEKVRDGSAILGLSSNTVLRTCFRVGEMINQSVRCLTRQHDAVFELFARVTYSNRENLERRQHFQFVDLFKDQRPYPAGILTGWRVGGRLDRQSAAFLPVKAEPRICRCLCRPKRDPKAATGLILTIISIREADWTQIRWAKKLVCGDPDGTAMASQDIRSGELKARDT